MLVNNYKKIVSDHMASGVMNRFQKEYAKANLEVIGDSVTIIKHMSDFEFTNLIQISRAGKNDEFDQLLCKYRNCSMAAEGIETEPLIIKKFCDGSAELAKKLFHEFEGSKPESEFRLTKEDKQKMREQWKKDNEYFDKHVMNSDVAQRFAEAFKKFNNEQQKQNQICRN